MPLISIVGPASRRYAASGGGGGAGDNPDSFPTTGNLWRSDDFETSTDQNPLTIDAWSMGTFRYGAYGYNGTNAHRFTPGTTAEPPEGRAGWRGLNSVSMPVDSANLVIYSYILELSSLYISRVANTGSPHYCFNNKIIDQTQWNSAGTDETGSTIGYRHVMFTIYPTHRGFSTYNHMVFDCRCGGATAEFYDDGVNSVFHLDEHPNEKIWVCHAFDGRVGSATRGVTTYVKLTTDSSVRRVLYRSASVADPFTGDTLAWTGRGFHNGGGTRAMIWNYWDDVNLTEDVDAWAMIDRVRVADYWTGPPF